MYEKRNPKMKSLLMVSSIITMGVITLIWVLAVVLCENFMSKYNLDIIGTGVIVLLWVISLISPFVRYNWYRARITEEEIDIREGFLFISECIIPIERLQKITMETGPLDRMFGMTKVNVFTAGGDETIRFLETERAEEICAQLKARINMYAKADREE